MARQAILIALLLCSLCLGDTKRLTAKKEHLYEIRLEKRCAFIVQQPLDLDVRSFDLADGKQTLVFWSGQNSQIVIVTFTNGEQIPDVTQYVIDLDDPVPPGPNPPNPGPSPEGFAKEVRDYVAKLALDDIWKKATAMTLETVSSEIAAGAIKTRESANSRIYTLNGIQPAASKPFWSFIEKHLTDKDIKTPEQMAATFTAIAEGLK